MTKKPSRHPSPRRAILESLEPRTLLSITYAQLPYIPLLFDSDKSFWFTDTGNRLAHSGLDGTITDYDLSSLGVTPTSPIRGPDNNIWFTPPGYYNANTPNSGSVTRLNLTDGALASFPATGLGPTLTVGPDQNLWSAGTSISKITTAGAVTTYPIPNFGSDTSSCASNLISAPDGNLYALFAALKPNPAAQGLDYEGFDYFALGRISTTGQVTYVATLGGMRLNISGVSFNQLLLGPDHNFWFRFTNTQQPMPTVCGLARVTPTGTVSTFTTDDWLGTAAFASDGNLYFTRSNRNTTLTYLEPMDINGNFLPFLPLPLPQSNISHGFTPYDFTADPDGDLIASTFPNFTHYRININTNIGNVSPGQHILAVAVGPSADDTPPLQVLDPDTGFVRYSINVFPESDFPNFHGGFHVALADVSGDNVADLIVSAGDAGNSLVRVYSGVDGAPLTTFYAFDPTEFPNYMGDTFVTTGNIGPNNSPLILASASSAGAVPLVRILTYTGNLLANFYAFDPSWNCGVRLAVGDINHDGIPEIVAAPASGLYGAFPIHVIDAFSHNVIVGAYPAITAGGVPITGSTTQGLQVAILSSGYLVVTQGPDTTNPQVAWYSLGDFDQNPLPGGTYLDRQAGVGPIFYPWIGPTFYPFLPASPGAQPADGGDITHFREHELILGQSNGVMTVVVAGPGGADANLFAGTFRRVYHSLPIPAPVYPAYA